MQNLKRNNMNIIILTLVISLGCLTLAYAVLSTSLNINFGNVTQNALTWDVGFEEGTITGISAGTSETGRSCGTAAVTATTVTLGTTSLSKPGDKCTYPLKIKNNGGIAATLTSIASKNPASISCTEGESSMVCGNITYKLTSDNDGTTALPINTTIDIDGETTAYLVVSYTGNSLNSSSATQTNGGFVVTYSQK